LFKNVKLKGVNWHDLMLYTVMSRNSKSLLIPRSFGKTGQLNFCTFAAEIHPDASKRGLHSKHSTVDVSISQKGSAFATQNFQ
jgi:hypothetical protein